MGFFIGIIKCPCTPYTEIRPKYLEIRIIDKYYILMFSLIILEDMNKTKVINLKGTVHKSLKLYCARHGLKMQFFVEGLIEDAIKQKPRQWKEK